MNTVRLFTYDFTWKKPMSRIILKKQVISLKSCLPFNPIWFDVVCACIYSFVCKGECPDPRRWSSTIQPGNSLEFVGPFPPDSKFIGRIKPLYPESKIHSTLIVCQYVCKRLYLDGLRGCTFTVMWASSEILEAIGRSLLLGIFVLPTAK